MLLINDVLVDTYNAFVVMVEANSTKRTPRMDALQQIVLSNRS